LAPILELERPGTVSEMVDIDGDGLRDFIVLEGNAPTWWLAGLPDPSVDELAQPLGVPDTPYGSWLDADGDGPADWLESAEAFAVLHKGDGTGGFAPAGMLDYGGQLGGVRGWPSGIPGRPLVAFQGGSLDTPSQAMWGVEVSAAGEIAVLVSGPIGGYTRIRHVSDLDGDMIPDALAYEPFRDSSLHFIHQSRAGVYDSEVTYVPVVEMVAGSFVTAGDVDLLYWSDDESEVLLRPRENGAWPTVIPVTVVGSWQPTGERHTMQADGEGGLEILHRASENDEWVHELWTLEPCR
jgi:hypothetical protein